MEKRRCRSWTIRFMKSGSKEVDEERFRKILARRFPQHIIEKILDKIELISGIQEKREEEISRAPYKYAKHKMKDIKDDYGNPLFSVKVTGDIRIIYSVNEKDCIIYIWIDRIGGHKVAYK